LLILGIETSCDETAAAVVQDGRKILSNIIASQVEFHAEYGGIVPEIASRKHIEVINQVVTSALKHADVKLNNIDAIAVTWGPGLVGSLLIGVSFAKALSYACNIPLIPINHLEAHIYAVYLEYTEIKLPAIALVISGGHTELIWMKDIGEYKTLGRTKDDAIGEAYDKVAKWLKLGYPGGPVIDKLAQNGNPQAVIFPKPMIKYGRYDFSYSGLKTAVINYTKMRKKTDISVKDIVASFQEAAISALIGKLMNAVKDKAAKTIIIGGGVAANSRLKTYLREKIADKDITVYIPSPELCTDNAAMVAGLAYHKYHNEEFATLELGVEPNLRI
jgi:N6-L-threonylcarbamoyladenine synthase